MGLFSKNKEEVKSDLPAMPPAPSMTAPSMSTPDAPKIDSISNVGNLEVPTIPGLDHFSDIKSQVTAGSNLDETSKNTNLAISEPNLDNSDSDSLFDLSGIDIPDMNNNLNELDSLEEISPSTTQVDANIGHMENLNFVSRNHSRAKVDENIFVTTAQFKTLLEIVESVKSKVKDASETHLRLLDIKSEEDVEYENLRKSFQFIEDKLYEVDSLIFEK